MSAQLQGAPADVLAAFNKLNPRQQAFALALPAAASQEAAALAAGYGAQHANKNAHALAAKPEVRIVVAYLAGAALKAAEDDLERLIREACHVALADPIGMVNADGSLKPLHEWPENLRRALASYDLAEISAGSGAEKVCIGTLAKPRFWNKLDAIEKIAKIRGYLAPEKHEHTHRLTGMGDLLAEIDGAGTGPAQRG